MLRPLTALPLFIAFTSINVDAAPASIGNLLQNAASEDDVLNTIESTSFDLAAVIAEDVDSLVHRGWHAAVQSLVARSQQRGTETERQHVSAQVRQAIQGAKHRLDDLTRALDANFNKAIDVSPAMQWAQNSTHVFLAVKFCQRWNAPGALEVQNHSVDISDCCLNFTAYGEHSFIRRRYHLNFELFLPLQPSQSSWHFAAAGRVTVTFAKEKTGNWPRLFHDAAASPKNLGIWRDMKEKWKADLSQFKVLGDAKAETSKEKPEKKQTDKKKDGKGSGPSSSGRRRTVEDDSSDEETDASDEINELLADCPKAAYQGSSVAELCDKAWKKAVEKATKPWLIELYSSMGGGNAQAMSNLMPVWKRLADVFPSQVPGGRVGALDCSVDRKLCKSLGVSLDDLPQVRRVLQPGQKGMSIWKRPLDASMEEFVTWARGEGKHEL